MWQQWKLDQYLQIVLGVNLLQHVSHLSKTLKMGLLSRSIDTPPPHCRHHCGTGSSPLGWPPVKYSLNVYSQWICTTVCQQFQYLHGLQNGLAGLRKHKARLHHRAQLGLRRHIVALQPLHIISELPVSIYRMMPIDRIWPDGPLSLKLASSMTGVVKVLVLQKI